MHASEGGFFFLPSDGRVFAKGIAAMPGHALRRICLRKTMPMEGGLNLAADFIRETGRPPSSFAGCELRIPHRLSRDDFRGFNRRYIEALRASGFPTHPTNPAARTNVTPLPDPPSEAMLHAFTFAVPQDQDSGDFLISGMPELAADPPRVVAPNDTSSAGLWEKANFVMEDLRNTVRQLGAQWESATASQVYTRHSLDAIMDLLPRDVAHVAANPPTLGPGDIPFELEADIRAITYEEAV